MPRVRITDVAPRDGLQNEPRPISTADKVRLVDALSAAAVDEIEVSSFVSPKWIPQLGDAAEVFAAIDPHPSITYSALVPNERGLQSALEVRAATHARLRRALPDKLAVFTAASQTFSRRNTNATIEETIQRFAPIAHACNRGLDGLAAGSAPPPTGSASRVPLRAYVSCVIACPFEGPITPAAVGRVVRMLLDLGADEIDLGDTIGAATPDSLARLLEHILPLIPARDPFEARGPSLTLHLHDTFGAAAACAVRALDMGVRSFDSAAGGLGGCPYASTPGRRAPGNISTSTLLTAVEKAGLTTGVHRDRLADASTVAAAMAGRQPPEALP